MKIIEPYKESTVASEVKELGTIVADWLDDGIRVLVMRGPSSFTAYIGFLENHLLSGRDYDSIPIDCHGGLTFSSKGGDYWPKGFYWYGWDYAHYGDKVIYESSFNRDGKDWTIGEVIKDSLSTIQDFIKLAKLTEESNK